MAGRPRAAEGAPAFAGDDGSALRQALVDKLREAGCVRSPRVEAAFREVPRHLFLPGDSLATAYSDEAIITKKDRNGVPISSSSQPAIMAIMLEQLELKPGERVLEVGAGTGYNAALMAHIVGDAGLVVTVDIDQDLVASARRHLSAARFERVRVVCGDGAFGHSDGAPYDRIILTVGAWDIAPAWRDQLKPDGRLLLPLGLKGPQVSVAFEKVDGHLKSVSVKGCGFMLLRGAFAPPVSGAPLGGRSDIRLYVEGDRTVNSELAYDWLTGPSKDKPTTVAAAPGEVVYGGLGLWLGLREPDLCGLHAIGDQANGPVPPLVEFNSGTSKYAVAVGLLGEHGMCLFARPPGQHAEEATDRPGEVELHVRSYGEGEDLAERLTDHVIAWDDAGRPSLEGLRIRAYPQGIDYSAANDEFVIPRRWTDLVLDWKQSQMTSAPLS